MQQEIYCHIVVVTEVLLRLLVKRNALPLPVFFCPSFPGLRIDKLVFLILKLSQ